MAFFGLPGSLPFWIIRIKKRWDGAALIVYRLSGRRVFSRLSRVIRSLLWYLLDLDCSSGVPGMACITIAGSVTMVFISDRRLHSFPSVLRRFILLSGESVPGSQALTRVFGFQHVWLISAHRMSLAFNCLDPLMYLDEDMKRNPLLPAAQASSYGLPLGRLWIKGSPCPPPCSPFCGSPPPFPSR